MSIHEYLNKIGLLNVASGRAAIEPWLSELSELSSTVGKLSGTVRYCRKHCRKHCRMTVLSGLSSTVESTVGNCQATVEVF